MNLIEIVRDVARQYPALLQSNTGASCYQFITHVLGRLKAEGHAGWGYVGKTDGESQYRPPVGFPRSVGPHTITGVSHDAIGSPLQRVDLIGGSHDGPDPLGTPGSPQWIEIPPHHWRPSNPIIAFEGPAPQPAPPPVGKPYPGDAFFIEQLGVVLDADYALAGQRLNAGSSVWFSRTLWRYLHEGMSIEQSVAQSRVEWRKALGLP